jgi:RNA polymerase sigma-70 factor (ECF subfamily)
VTFEKAKPTSCKFLIWYYNSPANAYALSMKAAVPNERSNLHCIPIQPASAIFAYELCLSDFSCNQRSSLVAKEAVVYFCVHSFFILLMETDHTLLNAARKMNQDALVKIFDLYSSSLFNYAVRLCSDPVIADHIVGDVFAKLLDQLAAGNGPTSNLRSYLYEMTYHRIIDEARSARHKAPLEVAATLGQDTQPVYLSVEEQLAFKQILHAIQNELTADHRHVIVLRYMEQFSLRETAAIMGKTVDHVKVIQNRAVAALRRSVERNGIRKTVSTPHIGDFSEAIGV